MPMSIRQFETTRAVEVIDRSYGSGYRIGGRLVLTAAHLLSDLGSDCIVRARSFGEKTAQVVWKAQNRDLALIELPDEIAKVEAIALGILPEGKKGEKIRFQMFGYPRWGWIRRDQVPAARGLQVEGTICLADTALVLRIEEHLASEYLAERVIRENREDSRELKSEWQGMSGAAVICDGLVVAVQKEHPRPMQPNLVDATPLWTIYKDEQWLQLLEKHEICPEPEIARIQTAEKPLEIPWHEVSLQLLEKRLQLTTNPMTENIAYQAEQVYVPLGLVERKKKPRRRSDVLPEHGSELYGEGPEKGQSHQKSQSLRDAESEEVEVTERFEHQQFLEQVLQRGQSPKSQGKRIAIIGEPGAGKTTQLQQIGRWIPKKFPESIVIWVALADLGGRNLKQYVYETWLTSIVEYYGRSEASVQIRDAFIAQCNQGRVWLLLDGLDEMQVAGSPLSEMQRQIQEGGWLQQARMLLTCRVNLWDGNRNALEKFDTYRTLEFDDSGRVEEFIEKWFAPRGNAAIQQGQALCEAIQKPGKERIWDLVKNPLRLTLLCFDWSLKSGRLPEIQAELYQRFVDRIYEWKAEEFPTTPEQRQALNRALAELSLAAIDDQDEQGNGRFQLSHGFVQKFLSVPLPNNSQQTLFELSLNLGWLNDIGVDADDQTQRIYAFYHTTFEEYFATLAINDWGFFLPREHRNQPVQDKLYRIFESQWKQVFLLWLGRSDIQKKEKEQLIRSLVEFKDGCKGFYNDRALLIAAEGITEFKDCEIKSRIVSQLIQWGLGKYRSSKRIWFVRSISRSQIIENRARLVLNKTDRVLAIQILTELLEKLHPLANFQEEDDRRKIAEILGQIGYLSNLAIQALVNILESNQNRRFLETSDQLQFIKNQKILKKISDFWDLNLWWLRHPLRYDSVMCSAKDLSLILDYQETRISAAKSLGEIALGSELAIRMLVNVLKNADTEYSGTNHQYWETKQFEPAKFLMLSNADPRIPKFLQQVELERYLCQTAAKSLIMIGHNHQLAIQETAKLMSEILHYHNRYHVIKVLEEIGVNNELAIQALVDFVDNSLNKNEILFWNLNAPSLPIVADGLAKIAFGNEKAIKSLKRLILYVHKNLTFLKSIPRRPADRFIYIGNTEDASISSDIRSMQNILIRAAKSLVKISTGTSKEEEISALFNSVGLESIGIVSDGKNNLKKNTLDKDMMRGLNKNRSVQNKFAAVSLSQIAALRYRSDSVENQRLMMMCSEKFSYPEFYQAFHA